MIENKIQVGRSGLKFFVRHFYLNASIPKNINSPTGVGRIGIHRTNVDPLDPRIKNSLYAGRGPTSGRTGFEGYEHGRPVFGYTTKSTDCLHLSMGRTCLLVIAFGNDLSTLHNQSPDHGVGMGITPSFACKNESLLKKSFFLRLVHPLRFLRLPLCKREPHRTMIRSFDL